MLLLLFIIALKFARSTVCTRDVYPIIHGNYFSNLSLPGLPSDFTYNYAANPNVVKVDTYSNGDISLTYNLQLVDGFQNTGIALGQVCTVAKIDFTTGSTIWAKRLYSTLGVNVLMVSNSYLVNDISWSMLINTDIIGSYPGIIFKLDANGVALDTFAVMNSYSSSSNNALLYVYNFNVLSDSSMVIYAQTTYLPNEFGVSSTSQFDLTLFKLDSNKDLQWSTSVDYFNGSEEEASAYIENDQIYVSLSTNNYLCQFTLDSKMGKLNKSKCLYLVKVSNDYRLYKVFYVSDLYVYSFIYTSNPNPSYIFLCDAATLQALKIFNINRLSYPVVTQNPNNSNIINIIFRNSINIYSLTVNELDLSTIQNYTYSTTWTQNVALNYGFAIAKHLNNNFVFSITNQMIYNEIGSIGLENKVLLLDFDLKSDSCIGFSKSNGIPSLSIEDLNKFTNQSNSNFNMSASPNLFSSVSSSLYVKSANPGNYTITDVTEYLWPRYFWNDYGTCNFNLPRFLLNSIFNIAIGSNISNTAYKLIPFNQCQNSLFVFSAIEQSTLSTPNWMTVDLSSKSITIDTTKIHSVIDSFEIEFSAELIPFPSPTYTQFPHNYLTYSYSSTFTFSNSLPIYVSSNATNYLVLNQITIFTLSFYDEELDPIIVKISENNNINSFVQSVPNNPSLMNVLLMANTISDGSNKLTIQYTDTYHNDVSYYKTIEFNLYLFASDPPVFSQELQQLNATRCTDYLITLPPIIDVNNLTCMVKLVNSPSWVLLKSANTIELNTSDLDYQIPKTSLITIRITNEMNSWSEYNLTVNVQDIITPIFGNLKDFSLPRNKTSTIKIDFQGDSNIIAIDCLSKATLSWITYNPASKELIINTNGIILKSQCAILKTFDSCNHVIYSDKFDILILNLMPLYIGNSIGRLIMFKGENKSFSIPTDLFVFPHPQSLKLKVNVLNCSEYAPIISKIVSSDNATNSFLYVNSNTTMSCTCSISATDSSNQTVETTFYLDVQSCFSINCLKCTNGLPSGCIECIDNYELTSSGECLLSSRYFKQPFEDMFSICGFIIFIILLINFLTTFIFGLTMLQSLEFAQTLIIFIYSTQHFNNDLIHFGSWLQISKLDLGFLYTTQITNLLSCDLDSRLSDIQFYCQSFCLNYIFLIELIFLAIIMLKVINIIPDLLKIVQSIVLIINSRITKEKIAWIFVHLFIPFALINLVNEAFSISNHLIVTLISFTITIVITVFILVTNSDIMTLDFIRSIDQYNPISFTLLTVVKLLLHTCMFLYNGDRLRTYMEYLELGVHLLITCVIYFHYKQKGTSLLLIIKHMIFPVILFMLVLSSHFDISEQLLKTEVMLIVAFFIFLLFTEPIPFIVSRYTKVK